MNIEKIKIKNLKEYELNAKKHPDEQIEGIMQSIKTFGFLQPVVIDAKNEIIIGHGRTKAAHRLGMDELPCVRVEGLTEAQIRTLRLIDNRIAETGWDIELLNQDLSMLDADLSGFNVDFDFVADEMTENEDDQEDETAGDGDVVACIVSFDSVDEMNKFMAKTRAQGYKCKVA